MKISDDELIKKYKKQELISAKKIEILKLIEKYGIIDARSVAILAGQNSDTYTRKVLHSLSQGGYLAKTTVAGRNCYYLLKKSKIELGTQSHVYKITNQVFHDLAAARSAAWLYLNLQAAESQIDSDRQNKRNMRGKGYHIPDIAVGNTCYEIELNHKPADKILKNVRDNASNFAAQVWIYPRTRPGIKTKITAAAQQLQNKGMQFSIKFLSLDDIDSYIASYFEAVKTGKADKNSVKSKNEQIKHQNINKKGSISTQSVKDKYMQQPVPQQPAPQEEKANDNDWGCLGQLLNS